MFFSGSRISPPRWADIVVAEIAVDGAEHGGTKAGKPHRGKLKRARRKIECKSCVEVADATPDEPEHGAHNANPQEHRDFADRGDASVKKDYEKYDQATSKGFLLPPVKRIKKFGVILEADGSGRDRQRRLDQRLTDEKEGHETSPFLGAVGFAKKNVGAAGFGHCRAKFRPDERVEGGDEGAGEPGDQRLRPAHGFDDERTRDERADAHNLDHVEGDRFFQAETALQLKLRRYRCVVLGRGSHAQ